jgi:hypothetical protein
MINEEIVSLITCGTETRQRPPAFQPGLILPSFGPDLLERPTTG